MASVAPNANVLNSWKEIAQHLGRGVRTVQRWERDLGMPVRRPRAKSRSAVIAMTEELDTWLRSAPTDCLKENDHVAAPPPEALARFHLVVQQHLELRERCHSLCAANNVALAALVKRLDEMRTSVQEGRIREALLSSNNNHAASA
jgi:hypothetical protein